MVTDASLADLLRAWLPPHVLAFAMRAGSLLHDRGVRAYAVGGVVRDALLGRPFPGDVDLTVEGDGIAAAEALAAALGGEVASRSAFGTARLQLPGLEVDVVTARRERYARPGALPTVEPGSLEDDLRRRDFTINAMAAALWPAAFGALHDPCGGRDDLRAGVVRVLHRDSFHDDPTRTVRAVRYGTRLAFTIEAETAALLREAAPELAGLSGTRRWHELQRCLQEDRPDLQCEALDTWGLLARLHPALACTREVRDRFARWRQARYDDPCDATVFLLLLCWDVTEPEAEALITGLELPGEQARPLRALPALRAALATAAAASEVAALLDAAPEPAVQAALYGPTDPGVRARVRAYRALWRHVRPHLRGDDLLREGVPEGPTVGRYLAALRAARLQEVARTADDERWLVRDMLQSEGAGGRA